MLQKGCFCYWSEVGGAESGALFTFCHSERSEESSSISMANLQGEEDSSFLRMTRVL